MTLQDRLKQLLVAMLIVAGVSSVMVILALRCDRTATFFGGGGKLDARTRPFTRGTVNDGCPLHDHALSKDLTIHFSFEAPMADFDGWIEIDKRRANDGIVLYSGRYSPTITIQGVCYDEAPSGVDAIQLGFNLITKHHAHDVLVWDEFHLGSYSEVAVEFRLGRRLSRPYASVRPVR
jgi:hypothetical protein